MQDRKTLISDLDTANESQELVELMRKENNAETSIIQLGVGVDKLQMLSTDDRIEINPKEWLDKNNWRDKGNISETWNFMAIVLKDGYWNKS